LIAEIQGLKDGDAVALWAHRRLPAKNTLTAEDTRAVEAACQIVLSALNLGADELEQHPAEPASIVPNDGNGSVAPPVPVAAEDQNTESMVTPQGKEMRRRNKAHLAFVSSQPCVVCQRSPCDAHHLKFAQPRSLGRKVSDEFTVPLCREHHQELHRHGNERAWWANLQITPLEVAGELWVATLLQVELTTDRQTTEVTKREPGLKLDPANDAEGVLSRNALGRSGP
jgi:hypothetical protein